MRRATVRIVHDWLEEAAPFAAQEEFDNSGLQTGHPDRTVSNILLALDVTDEVIREAVNLGAELIISHHPPLFLPLRSMGEESYIPSILASLIRSGISLIAAHTNLDQSADFSPGVAVADLLQLRNIRREGRYLAVGDLPDKMSAETLKGTISIALGNPVFLFDVPGKTVRTLAIAGGAYSEGFQEAISAGAQALLTGEVRHHHAVEAVARGLVIYEGGHFATEAPMLRPMAAGLQKYLDRLEYSVRVFVSQSQPYHLG